jgi:hypothetical protein
MIVTLHIASLALHCRRNAAVSAVNAQDGAVTSELDEATAVLRQEQQHYAGLVEANKALVRGVSEHERVQTSVTLPRYMWCAMRSNRCIL